MYVKDPASAALSFRAMDKDLFSEDDLLGLGAISVQELQVRERERYQISNLTRLDWIGLDWDRLNKT